MEEPVVPEELDGRAALVELDVFAPLLPEDDLPPTTEFTTLLMMLDRSAILELLSFYHLEAV